MNKKWLAVLALGTLTLIFILTPTGKTLGNELSRVLVMNFPDIFQVEGQVKIEGPVKLSELVTFNEIIVPPVEPNDTTRLVEAGTLVTAGFRNAVLSLHGQVKGSVKNTGSVGAILIPKQANIQLAFNEQGQFHFAMEVSASGVSSRTPFFASTQPEYPIGFQAYEVLLYNTTDKTVTVDLFAYLTN